MLNINVKPNTNIKNIKKSILTSHATMFSVSIRPWDDLCCWKAWLNPPPPPHTRFLQFFFFLFWKCSYRIGNPRSQWRADCRYSTDRSQAAISNILELPGFPVLEQQDWLQLEPVRNRVQREAVHGRYHQPLLLRGQVAQDQSAQHVTMAGRGAASGEL